jgi:hypothetical protein
MRSDVGPQPGQGLFVEIPEGRHDIDGESIPRRRITGVAVDLPGIACLCQDRINRHEIGLMDEQIYVGQRSCPANAIELHEDGESFQGHIGDAGSFKQSGEAMKLIERGSIADAPVWPTL